MVTRLCERCGRGVLVSKDHEIEGSNGQISGSGCAFDSGVVRGTNRSGEGFENVRLMGSTKHWTIPI